MLENGDFVLLFAKNDNVLGLIAVADTLRDDSKEAIEELENES